MSIAETVMAATVKRLSRMLCRVDDSQLWQVPAHGPLILAANHINFLDVPVVYSHLRPRRVTGFAKVETWDNPALGWAFTLAGAIPLHRGEADVGALRRGLKVLQSGHILAVAPEGTRSNDGRLQRGHSGVVVMALLSGAPILPVAYYGQETLRKNLRRLRRTDFAIRVGRPFSIETGGVKVTREVRQEIADEIMYQIAALLPPAYRGCYSDLSASSETYLRFLSPTDKDPQITQST